MSETALDAVVIGAGQAGLAISYFLQRHGTPHIVLERGRIGESWRTQRWDSFVLNSPNKFNVLPGDAYRGKDPDGFDGAESFVSTLEEYAKRFHLPVLEHAPVVSVERGSSSYRVAALVDGATRSYTCRQVVVASGAMNEKKIPSFAGDISPNIWQCHAGEYRSPRDLPDGAVLVVGSAQSGLQVAEDIIEAGKRVYLSTSAVGRVPRRYRGKDIFDWLLQIGYFDLKSEEVADPKELQLRQPQVSGVGPRGHTQSLQSLARQGAVVIGKVDGASGDAVSLQPNAGAHVKFSDEVSRGIKGRIEEYIATNRLDVAPPESDPADEPDTDAACTSPLKVLHLKREDIRSIIWATGFAADFSYLGGQAVDGSGRPVHRSGISTVAGLYFAGLPWLRKRKSGIINGIAEDAEFIARRVIGSSQWQ